MATPEIRKKIKEAVVKVFGEGAGVETPENKEHGDYATSAGLALSKKEKKNPVEFASEKQIELNGLVGVFSDTAIAGPGFINFFLKNDFVLKNLQEVKKNSKKWGESAVGKGKTVLVEYFQLNIAKRPHVGHLRSAVIGDAIKRLLLSQGFNAISDTHVGDWGTQFGILLLALKRPGSAAGVNTEGDPFEDLDRLYVEENKRIESDPELREKAKEEFAKLEQGDKENRKLWKWMVALSMKKLEEGALRLGLLDFDEHKGESSYEKDMPKIVELALKKGIAKKLEDGAVAVDLTGEKLDEAILIKSDGASTYVLRDLAAIIYRKKEHAFAQNLYVVDVRQQHHFKQVFRVAELLGFEGAGESKHIEFGFMKLPEGPMSTRAGNTISLNSLLDESEKRAEAVIEEKNPGLKDKKSVASIVGLGAIKFFDLSHNRRSDIIFKWEDALSFEGDTGPYVQYTHARLKSILRKAKEAGVKAKISGTPPLDVLEHRLAVSILRLPEVIEDALADFLPNILTNYLFHLASIANEFYHSHPVIQEPDGSKKAVRLLLVETAAGTLSRGLGLLGIDAPEEM